MMAFEACTMPFWTAPRTGFSRRSTSRSSATLTKRRSSRCLTTSRSIGLDWLNPPGFTYPLTVRRLPTFLDRNRLNPYNALSASPPYFMRNYAVQGGNLQLYPKLNCGGDYRLYYQVQIAPLAYPVPREFNVTAG